MTLPIPDPTFRIYLALSQYPILQTRIRDKMLQELVSRGLITLKEFETQVREQAWLSQGRESIDEPIGEEPEDIWEVRKRKIQDYLTDMYFSNNLPYELFEEIMQDTLAEQGADTDILLVTFNPELAPQEMLFDQALAIYNLPKKERKRYEARLQEIKVVLIRRMISDQLAYINIAKQWFTVDDLVAIRKRKIGRGKIGGKAAGMLLAERILKEEAEKDIRESIHIPKSFFLGADVMYSFMAYNNLMHWADQKYKPAEQIRADYPVIQDEYRKGEFSADMLEELQKILDKIKDQPLIVRSSSLLEDNFGSSFAGKYDSFFCPNQGTPKENLKNLCTAITSVYSSALNADALLYRRSHGFQDYDERIAVLIQVVEGEMQGEYYMPHVSGVGFSRNLYRWSPQIRQEDGFLRLVWGLGTRAVERVGNDYPRLVALSHPKLRAESSPKEISRYSQHLVDVIDLEENEFKTIPVQEALDPSDAVIRYLAQVYQDDFMAPIRSNLIGSKAEHLVITLEELLVRTPLADKMRKILNILEEHYSVPVDTEFTVRIRNPRDTKPDVDICLLQCRPQSHLLESLIQLPDNLPKEDVVFETSRVLPHGKVEGIRYVLFVTPEGYYSLPTPAARTELGKAISSINAALEGQNFICVGPGRWGSTNPDLGVRIGYADIYNARALIEISGKGVGSAPEPSFGTHFFQDLIESNIFPLAIYLDDEDVVFNRAFFYDSENCLARFLPKAKKLKESLLLIDVDTVRPDNRLELVMDSKEGRAVAFLSPNSGVEEEENA